jgi:hypothetical protein
MSEQNPIILFWTAPDGALFAPSVIAAVRNVTPALLERERWQRTGPKHLKLVGRVLYRKADVLQWIEQQQVAVAFERSLEPPGIGVEPALDEASPHTRPKPPLPTQHGSEFRSRDEPD